MMIKTFTKVLLLVTLMTEATVNAKSRYLGKQKKLRMGKKASGLVADMAPYPGSTETVSGTVYLTFDHDMNIMIEMDVEGVPSCSTSVTESNGCGIHIHAGISCHNAVDVEGHFWKIPAFDSDPWSPVRYNADSQGKSTYKTEMEGGNGYGADMNFGRAFVIHNAVGGRIGCGLLEKA
mmetsp:Transcript_28130/g.39573  ORF Transcript_28130/g.39573 Transcript_28130/m.39573 type:complete len:178 (+) Transcript_28130:139-672(+)